jgi:hypothetical protein
MNIDDIKKNEFEKSYLEVSNFFNSIQANYPHFGIHKHHIIFFLALVKFFKIEIIIESGIGPGHSTKHIMQFCNQYKINSISIDLNNNNFYYDKKIIDFIDRDFSKFVEGDGFIEVIKQIKKNKNKKIALLLDGPKNIEALSLFYSCNLISNNIEFCLLDDVMENSNTHEILNKNNNNNYFYLYDLLKKNNIFRNDKKKTLQIFYNEKNLYPNLSKSRYANLFQKREVILLKTKRYFNMKFLTINPFIIYLLTQLNLISLIKILLKLFRKMQLLINLKKKL